MRVKQVWDKSGTVASKQGATSPVQVPVASVLDETLADETSRLFLAMAEGLKQPLLHISHSAELAGASHVAEGIGAGPEGRLGSLADIRRTADMSLQLLDSYALSLRLSLQPASRLELEPVSVSAVLHDTAQELRHVAAQYGVHLQLHVQGRYEPVLAHRQALQAALVSLGYGLIEALPAAGSANGQQVRLQLASHRTKQGIVAGLYGQLDDLTPQAFRQAQGLYGRVRQPLVAGLPGSGAGIFVADTILAAMASRLRVGRYQKMSGFAVTLPASEQLQLV